MIRRKKLHEKSQQTPNPERERVFKEMRRVSRHYCDHRNTKLMEKLQSEQGPRWMNRWVLEQKRKNKK